MSKKRVIPLLEPGSVAAKAAEKRRIVLRRITNVWSLEDTLRAFSSEVFHSPRVQRSLVIGWLEELLEDLKDTKTMSEGN